MCIMSWLNWLSSEDAFFILGQPDLELGLSFQVFLGHRPVFQLAREPLCVMWDASSSHLPLLQPLFPSRKPSSEIQISARVAFLRKSGRGLEQPFRQSLVRGSCKPNSNDWLHLAGRYSTPWVQESRCHWVFKVGQSHYPKTSLKPFNKALCARRLFVQRPHIVPILVRYKMKGMRKVQVLIWIGMKNLLPIQQFNNCYQ